ncbi:MAG TPA: hypothetical protein VKR53_01795 [Puia sp.]|nr:hypothetical protein [Puia sp.]
MKSKIMLCLLIQAAVTVINAQQPQNHNAWWFRSIDNLGLAAGQKNTALVMQTTGGFQHKSLFAGVGAGLDYYGFLSVPLFVDLRMYLSPNKNAFFIYEDGGVNIIWQKKSIENFTSGYHHNHGYYNDFGAGYKFHLKDRTSVILSGGYTYKRISESVSNQECPFAGPCYLQKDKYIYDLSRLIFKIGLEF